MNTNYAFPVIQIVKRTNLHKKLKMINDKEEGGVEDGNTSEELDPTSPFLLECEEFPDPRTEVLMVS